MSEKLETVLQITEQMNLYADMDELLNFIVSESAQLLEAERGSLMLLDESSKNLIVKASKGLNEEFLNSSAKIGESIAGWIFQEGKPVIITDIENSPSICRKNNPGYKTKSFMIVPLKVEQTVKGVINISDKISRASHIFDEEDLRFMMIIAHQAGIAIERLRLSGELDQLQIKDTLTGLYNKNYFHQCLSDEVLRAQRYHRSLCLIVVDVDDFKHYNDINGYVMGNQVIKEIGHLLDNNVRQNDIVCHMGGPEFVVVLPEGNAAGAQKVAEKIRHHVENFPFIESYKQPMGKITISAGISEFYSDMNKEELIRIAYKALYESKRNGKNKVSFNV